jgi:hypothetical protein
VYVPSLSTGIVLCKAEILCFFILTNFVEGNSARTIVMRLPDSATSRGTLTSRLGRKHFFGELCLQWICEQFAWCEPCCRSDDTIQNYSDIFKLCFMWCRYNSDNRSVEETGIERQ